MEAEPERLWHPHRRGRPTLGRRQRQQPHTLCAQRQLQRQRRPGPHLRAWDQTTGANGGTANVSTNGGTTAYSTATETAAITVNGVNDAPVLDNTGTMTVTAINEDETNPAGITIANLIASAGGDRITDVDAGAVEGIAVTTVDNTNGTWQYSTNGGGSWSAFGTPTAACSTLGRRQRQQPHTLCAQRQLHRQRRPGPHLSRMGPDNRRQRTHRQRLHQRRHHRLLDGYRNGRHHRKRRKRRHPCWTIPAR